MKNHIQRFQKYFKSQVPEPNVKEQAMQLGKHCSKVTDTLMVFGIPYMEIQYTADDLKVGYYDLFLEARMREDDIRREITKSLAHQIVTALGVAHMYDLDVIGILDALDEDSLAELSYKDESPDDEDKPTDDENKPVDDKDVKDSESDSDA